MFPNNHMPLLQLEHDPGEEVLLVIQDDRIDITVGKQIDSFQERGRLDDLSGTFLGLRGIWQTLYGYLLLTILGPPCLN